MKHHIIALALVAAGALSSMAQSVTSPMEGKCGDDCSWSFDGYTLTISNTNKKGLTVEMDNYDTSHQLAPWRKKNLDVRKVTIRPGVTAIGSCAFMNLPNLQEVEFEGTDLNRIGWGAFMDCARLRTISIPVNVRNIETIAFANCDALTAVSIPDQCRVGDQAYASCDNIKSIELSPTSILGHYVFANEANVDGKTRHSLYNGEVRKVPAYINAENCNEFGLSPASIEKATSNYATEVNYDYVTSEVDDNLPMSFYARKNTYALVIGNQNYRFVSDVPYAIHDARVFADYCKKTLGIPAANVHVSEDATKQMILEEELEDWVGKIKDKEDSALIVYYAGHGVPDTKDGNKAYLLPTDVRGTSPQRGISLEDFYAKIGNLGFNQTTVFLDACFSGVNRENNGVTEGLRAVEIDVDDAALTNNNMVVFSAAQGNETAQGYPEQGHGLFTYYLLKSLRDSNGIISLGGLSDKISSGVTTTAPQMTMKKSQTPSTNASENLGDNWRNLRF